MGGDKASWLAWIGLTMTCLAAAAGILSVLFPEQRALLILLLVLFLIGAAASFREAIRARRAPTPLAGEGVFRAAEPMQAPASVEVPAEPLVTLSPDELRRRKGADIVGIPIRWKVYVERVERVGDRLSIFGIGASPNARSFLSGASIKNKIRSDMEWKQSLDLVRERDTVGIEGVVTGIEEPYVIVAATNPEPRFHAS